MDSRTAAVPTRRVQEGLASSIHLIDWPAAFGRGIDGWRELAARLVAAFPDRYLDGGALRWRIVLGDGVVRSPDGILARHRTLDVALRRLAGKPALLDVVAGNLFSRRGGPLVAEPTAAHPAQAMWIRDVARIPLAEQVQRVHGFAADLRYLGIDIQPAPCDVAHAQVPQVATGAGLRPFPFSGRHGLHRMPALPMPPDAAFAVIAAEASMVHWGADRLADSLCTLLGRPQSRVARLRRPNPDAVNLVLIDPSVHLAAEPGQRDLLRQWEAQGIRFKLANVAALGDRFASLNIAAKLFALAGGRAWRAPRPARVACSLDAGHDHRHDRSRWVAVETDAALEVRAVRVVDTPRAEHLPSAVLDTLWPVGRGGVLFRDGRLAQERDHATCRAAAESRDVLEIKKSPRALLWRQTRAGLQAAAPGDAAIDPHGEWLLQTAPGNANDPVHPVRLCTATGDAAAVVGDFVVQNIMPGPSLFHTPRLPGALFLADRISKLTGDGWTRAIGCGYRLPCLVP